MSKKFISLLLLTSAILFSGCNVPEIDPKQGDDPVIVIPPEPTVREVMEQAISDITSYVDKTLYRAEQVSTINEIIDFYSNKIRNCRDKSKIQEYVDECKAQLDLVKTNAELTEEEEKQNTKYKLINLMNKQEHYDVLFVGSSYTYYYDQYHLLESILTSEGYDVTCDQIVRGSATLQMFNDSTDELYEKLNKKLNENQYEFIFLEELSTRPLKKFNLFDEAVGTLLTRINASQNNCETILFEVWARDEECDWYKDNATYTYESMEKALADAYQTVGEKYGLRISYSGQSFQNVYINQNKAVDLYHTDKSHPNLNGAYLSALTHFNTLTGQDPAKVDFYPQDYRINDHGGINGAFSISKSDATILKNSVVNFYGEKKLVELRVFVWASNTSSAYYTNKEMEDIKRAIPKAAEKDVAISWNFATGVNKEGFKDYMEHAKDVDVVLAGGNMDTDIGLILETGEDLAKAKLGLNWCATANRYIGIIKDAKNIEVAKAVRKMLISDKEVGDIVNVLFIGNSYTFYNDMYLTFNDICDSLGLNVKAYKVTLGSRKLLDYQNNDNTTDELKNKLNTIKFSYIFLQEQSNTPASNYNNFINGISCVTRLIRNSDLNKEATILLYNTWAREEGNSYYSSHYTNLSSDKDKYLAMTKDLTKAFKNAGENFDYEVSYCGAAMYEVHSKYPNMIMYHTDKTHPSPLGSYMVALTHVAKLFNIDPREVNYIPNYTSFTEGDCAVINPTVSEAIILRTAAYNAVYNLDMSLFD